MGQSQKITGPHQVSALWRKPVKDAAGRVAGCVEQALGNPDRPGPVYVFFRADDVGVPGKHLKCLLTLFRQHRAPLSLAVVPAWLTRPRWEAIKKSAGSDPQLWCWHQHGFRHISHEGPEKKQEFGPSRSRSEQRSDLERGRRRLEAIMGRDFFPVFTPPWNRCAKDTLKLLEELGYQSVSRSLGSQPPAPRGLPEFSVTVDLHTRKEPDPAEAWEHLFNELFLSLHSGRCGLMIHHQRMNRAAFDFLEILLPALRKCKRVCLVNFKHLTEIFSRDLTVEGGL